MVAEERSRADFRAARERLGLTIANLADDLGVSVSAARRWDTLEGYRPPARAWELLDRYAETQRQCVDAACAAAVHATAQTPGAMPVSASVTYYRSQAEYDEFGRDTGHVGVANATARAVAAELERRGLDVHYHFPGEGVTRIPEIRC